MPGPGQAWPWGMRWCLGPRHHRPHGLVAQIGWCVQMGTLIVLCGQLGPCWWIEYNEQSVGVIQSPLEVVRAPLEVVRPHLEVVLPSLALVHLVHLVSLRVDPVAGSPVEDVQGMVVVGGMRR